ncbi:type II toxin-antitoxin system RelE/ParE family toxin [Sphingomonas sp.]|uniref:type II toxin-antitoxin system RelE/ParE family toxin n=1 Tax=Sphingomonas sp. TaxID=28214 RepID=UPI0035BC8073
MIVKLRARARTDLREIAAYSAEQHGDAVSAEPAHDRRGLARLRDYPELGEAYGDDPGVRSHPVGQHRVYYCRDGDRLSILRVLHKAGNVRRRL